jgi:protein TonB
MVVNQLSDIFSHDDHPSLWLLVRVFRVCIASVAALILTTGLIYFEQFLIAGGEAALDESPNSQLVDIVRVKEELEVVTRQRRKKPPPPDQAPESLKPKMVANFDLDSAYGMSNPAVGVSNDLQLGLGFGFSDGEYLPIVKVSPEYPRRALVEGLAGWMIVEFTVGKAGTVVDPIVVGNCAVPQREGQEVPVCVDRPDSIFDRSALKAAKKFKYKPKVIDGEPIDTTGVRNKITFVLGN